jgi:alkylation response protein AidB-like acyl-CoA dehydrogenase
MSAAEAAQQGPPLSASEILANARKLADGVREKDLAMEYDRIRHLPADIVQQVRDAGIMRMNMPKIWGGPEMTSMEQVEVIEALARADASIAWCAFIWCDSGLYSGYLDDAVGRAMYPNLDMATSGWVYPGAAAERVEGGYRVSGQWMFGSGCTHCDWLVAGCAVVRDGEPVLHASGLPEWRILMAKPEEYEILDTWYTTGLRGTGSNDYRAEDLFVPEERTFSFLDPARREGPLWARPDTLLRKMSGVPLGAAADAIETATALLDSKADRLSGVAYREIPRVQSAIGQARSLLGAARSYVYSSLETQWEKLEAGDELTPQERADVWLSRTHAFQAGLEITRLVYDAVGGSAIYSGKSPLDRHLRDMQTACQHVAGQTKGWEAVGSLLMTGDSQHPLL